MRLEYSQTLRESRELFSADTSALIELASPVLQALEVVQGLSSPLKEEVFVRELVSSLRRQGRIQERSSREECRVYAA
jgi:hypothetical protein